MTLILARRKFLIGLTAVMAAPVIVKYGNLMPVKAMPIEADLERVWLEIRRIGLAPIKSEGTRIPYDSQNYLPIR